MTINVRAIAVHGLGFAVALVAAQGLAPYTADQPQYTPNPDRIISIRASGRVAAIEDAARDILIRPETRLAAVEAEDRSISIGPEIRMLAIDAEDRVTTVNQETRTTTA